MPAIFEDDMNLLLIFGAGIPTEAYQNAHGLWTQPSMFASMLKTLFTRLQDCGSAVAQVRMAQLYIGQSSYTGTIQLYRDTPAVQGHSS